MAADALNRRNIKELVQDGPYPVLCDLGCDNGEWTIELARSSGSERAFGAEMVPESARLAESKGVRAIVSDLNEAFPFEDETFDLVHANQVIEHVKDVDHFVSEIIRVLKAGGVAVISTENGSSWHNIFAATMGWQIFSLTSVSARARSVGNPLALHRSDAPRGFPDTHRTIFNYRGLVEFFQAHGLTVVAARGAGYYPMPASFGRIDIRHCHFMTVKVRKAGAETSLRSS
jgi:SAM-dependent methyltransferase